MSTRRAHLTSLGLAAATPLAVAAPVALASAAPAAAATRVAGPMELVARRTKITLPDLPKLGVSYIALLDLFDSAGTKLGQASTSSFVVDVAVEGPIVLGTIVLQLADGEIHYQRLIRRYGDYPRTATGAITGGTGEYAGATGEVDVSCPDADTVQLAVKLG
ncbi:MAG: hypothetical protein ACRDT4_09915 [Micromonosporaceae bacterium]